MRLAIYDMDRTITRGGTWTPFLLFYARRVAPWRLLLLPVALLFAVAYTARRIDRARLKELNQRLLMGRHVPLERLRPVVERYADHVLATATHPGALEQVATDKADGWRVVLATASYDFYVRALASRFGIGDVIATGATLEAERLVARISGENCYGPAKLAMVRAWMEGQGLDRAACTVRFYSDHHSDLPVLEWADEPVATNPNDTLRAIARARGWRIVDWGRRGLGG